MTAWHRLFGITLTDFFLNTAYEVELEKDLSIKQQFIDVVIIEKGEGEIPEELPDGLENLATHNLMTYKSIQESLDAWTIEELCGHYVNYRKQISPKKLLPAADFRLYAVSTRYPKNLADRAELAKISPGVYDLRLGIRDIRVIVLSRIPKIKKNAPWLMFSAKTEKIQYAAEQYRWNSKVSSVINDLFKQYKLEGIVTMPYTMEDYQKDFKERFIKSLSTEEILKNLSKEDIRHLLKDLEPEERLQGLKPEEIEDYLKKVKK